MECPECGYNINGEDCTNCVFNVNEVEVNNIFNIYVLKCDENKYYVGKTNNEVGIRFSQHKNNNTCAFTSKYKPIEILETIQSKDPLDEDKITKKYMMKYGINNVRGGSYTKLELDEWMIKSLEHEFKSTRDICYKCNEKGHFYRDCPLNNKFNIQKYLEEFKEFDKIDEEINKLEKVYEQIIILNNQISRTNIINIDEYKECVHKQKNYEDKIKELQALSINNDTSNINRYEKQDKNRQFHQEMQKINQQKLENMEKLNRYISISSIYRDFFVNDIIYIHYQDNILIKLYKLQAFNLEKKKQLKELLNIHTSEDLIKMKLEGLYKKKIIILNSKLK
jgi:predicted GIY-YIG superfamily endonuclease